MSITPHVNVLSTQYLDQYCSSCAAPAPEAGLKRCPKCKTVHYCNQECQNKDWAWHKHECNALQKWAASAPSQEVSVPGDAVRCLGRILWGSQKEGPESNWVKEIRMMQSNRSSLQPSSFESHTHLAHSVVRYLGASSPSDLEPYGLNSAGDLVDLISRFTTNTFTLSSVALTPIGICIAPTIAFANHSCEPNAVIVFPRASNTPRSKEPSMNLIALREIAPGKEVRIAYVDTTLPKHLRQKELKETYSFTCQCKLCTRVTSVDAREALWCPKQCGGTCPLPTEENNLSRCVKCKAAVTNVDAVLDAVRVGQEALDKATSLQFRDPEKAKQYTTNLIPILTTAGLTPSSHPLLAMTHLHLELAIASLPSSMSQESLDEAIRTAAKYSAGLQGLLPKGHPIRAVALGELGKLLAVDEPSPPTDQAQASKFPPSGPPRLKLAYESLVRAHEELLIGFGKANQGGHVGRDVRDAIVRLEKELGVWNTGIKNTLEDTLMAQRAK
ncbi:SET domain-containing protein [Trametes sanguinea]|nr:SET domain-containing protein [Trametes sanguinea]